jgi:hypothetical protein
VRQSRSPRLPHLRPVQTQHSQAHGELARRIHAEVVMALAPGDFYKSMTTHADHRIWQDVYRPMTAAGRV